VRAARREWAAALALGDLSFSFGKNVFERDRCSTEVTEADTSNKP